jgi:hypothetical protein
MSILVATPMYGGQCRAEYFRSALALSRDLTTAGVEFDFWTGQNESAVHRARNEAVRTFLETPYKYLMFIDADIDFSSADVGKLYQAQTDIAVGLYRMKQDGAPLAAWVEGKLITELPKQRRIEVDYAGTGFMLIDRKVFEALKASTPSYTGPNGQTHQFFSFPIHNGVELSEDYNFCRLAREKGFKVVADTSITLGHVGSKTY